MPFTLRQFYESNASVRDPWGGLHIITHVDSTFDAALARALAEVRAMRHRPRADEIATHFTLREEVLYAHHPSTPVQQIVSVIEVLGNLTWRPSSINYSHWSDNILAAGEREFLRKQAAFCEAEFAGTGS